jgi:hypothetical protein
VGLLPFYRISGNMGCLIASDPPQPPLKRGAFRLNTMCVSGENPSSKSSGEHYLPGDRLRSPVGWVEKTYGVLGIKFFNFLLMLDKSQRFTNFINFFLQTPCIFI